MFCFFPNHLAVDNTLRLFQSCHINTAVSPFCSRTTLGVQANRFLWGPGDRFSRYLEGKKMIVFGIHIHQGQGYKDDSGGFLFVCLFCMRN